VSVVLFDLDEFKHINDTYGHLAGDSVLRDVGALFLRSTRPQDLIARYGGDEFVLVVQGLFPHEARQIAARLQREIGALRWAVGERSFTIRVTTGFAASHHLPNPEVPRLLQAADRDLYRNKTGAHGAESGDESMPLLMPADAPASRTGDPAPRPDRDVRPSARATSE
jgi:diguanylate cyclase (GGDEF)-like protein